MASSTPSPWPNYTSCSRSFQVAFYSHVNRNSGTILVGGKSLQSSVLFLLVIPKRQKQLTARCLNEVFRREEEVKIAAVAGVSEQQNLICFSGVCFFVFGLRQSFLCSMKYCGAKEVVIPFA